MVWKLEFKGSVSPTTSGLNVQTSKLSSPADSETGSFSVEYAISNDTVHAFVTVSDWPESESYKNIPAISMMVRSAIQGQLNVLNIINGTHVSVELEIYRQEPEGWEPISLDINFIADRYEDKEAKYRELMSLFSNPHDGIWFLQKINTDLNHAIRYPNETALFCYRAIETMARYFCESMFDNIKGEDWKKFRETIGVTREEIMKIKEQADFGRHGSVSPMPPGARVELFEATWEIYDKYIEFAKRNFDSIEPSFTRDRRAGRI